MSLQIPSVLHSIGSLLEILHALPTETSSFSSTSSTTSCSIIDLFESDIFQLLSSWNDTQRTECLQESCLKLYHFSYQVTKQISTNRATEKIGGSATTTSVSNILHNLVLSSAKYCLAVQWGGNEQQSRSMAIGRLKECPQLPLVLLGVPKGLGG